MQKKESFTSRARRQVAAWRNKWRHLLRSRRRLSVEHVNNGSVQVTAGTAYDRGGRLDLAPWLPPSRKTLLIRPSRAPESEESKLLLLLHGCRQSTDDFARGAAITEFAERHGWTVLMLSQSRRANWHRCWNWFDPATLRGKGEVAIALNALNEISASTKIGAAQTYVAGLSSGAALGAAMCACYPERFAGAMLHSGVPFGASKSPLDARRLLKTGPARDVTTMVSEGDYVPTLVVHGANDEVVVPVHADEIIRQSLTQSGGIAAGDPLPTPDHSATNPHPGHLARLDDFGPHRRILIEGLGHAWSGGADGEAYFDPAGPSALELMLDFVGHIGAPKSGEPLAA